MKHGHETSSLKQHLTNNRINTTMGILGMSSRVWTPLLPADRNFQNAYKQKLLTPLCLSNSKHAYSINHFHVIIITKANRLKTHLVMKMKVHISPSWEHHFKWNKVHGNQYIRTFHKHPMAWQKEKVDSLTCFGRTWWNSDYWMVSAQTVEDSSSKWWMMKVLQFKLAWNSSKL